ncbi:DUF563 domain-containing protein [Acetobacter musti]|uniref:DUF563 domain-containing protein n=1 Tax=Acetobacter musti TaxID=864732 RepID=A0ABX0JUX5_9PROT|nr:DUF563 domain-containing protein [Acetobacter musti]
MSLFSRFRRRIKNSQEYLPVSDHCLYQAAGNRTLIELSPRRRGIFAANGLLDDGSESLFRHWETSTTPIFRYSFGPAVFDPVLTMFGSDGRAIRDLLYTQLYTQPENVLKAFDADRETPVEVSDLTAWAGFDHWNSNFYHWFAHTLPAICHFRKAAGPDDVFLLPELTSWQAKSIELMGLPRERWKITRPGLRYKFARVIYTDFIRGKTDFTVSETLTETSRILKRAAGCGETRSGEYPQMRLLFIQRGSAANRKIPNETDLAAGLERVGFECVRPEKLSLREQICLFSEARMVVGFLGAGLTNIAWCAPGTIVYELVPSHHQNPCFLPIAIRNNLCYWADLVETGVMREDHTSQSVLPVDVEHVVRHAKALLHLTDA